MSEPATIKQVQREFAKKLAEYKRTLKDYEHAKAAECNCDRMSCPRCITLESLVEKLWRLRGF